jgi:hypothetical protein
VVLLGLLLTAGTAGAAPAGKIVFNSTLAGDREIVVINADGSGRTPLTDKGPTGVTTRPTGPRSYSRVTTGPMPST